MRPGRVLLAAVLLGTTIVPAVHAADNASELAKRALVECEAGRDLTSRSERKARFDRGQALAEQAIAADDNCADAHFALFCNLGELMRLDGESIRSALSPTAMDGRSPPATRFPPDRACEPAAPPGALRARLPAAGAPGGPEGGRTRCAFGTAGAGGRSFDRVP